MNGKTTGFASPAQGYEDTTGVMHSRAHRCAAAFEAVTRSLENLRKQYIN